MINGKVRQQLADMLQPFLAGKEIVDLASARRALHALMPSLAVEIDGHETSHVLRRAGFARDYSKPADPSVVQVGPSRYRKVSR